MVAALSEQQAQGVLAAAAPFQQAYLGAVLTRLSDAAGAAFPGGNRALPSSAELHKLIGWGLPVTHCADRQAGAGLQWIHMVL